MDMQTFIDWYNAEQQSDIRDKVDEETACVLLARGWDMATQEHNNRLDAIHAHVALLTQHE